MNDTNFDQEAIVKAVLEGMEKAAKEKEEKELAAQREQEAREQAAFEEQMRAEQQEMMKQYAKKKLSNALKSIGILILFWGIVFGAIKLVMGDFSKATREDYGFSIFMVIALSLVVLLVKIFFGVIRRFGILLGIVIYGVILSGLIVICGSIIGIAQNDMYNGSLVIGAVISLVLIICAIYNLVGYFNSRKN